MISPTHWRAAVSALLMVRIGARKETASRAGVARLAWRLAAGWSVVRSQSELPLPLASRLRRGVCAGACRSRPSAEAFLRDLVAARALALVLARISARGAHQGRRALVAIVCQPLPQRGLTFGRLAKKARLPRSSCRTFWRACLASFSSPLVVLVLPSPRPDARGKERLP